jgi:hypothetical protein
MDNEISIQVFCLCLDSRLGLLPVLKTMKILLKYGLSGHAAGDYLLGWFRVGSDGAVLLL